MLDFLKIETRPGKRNTIEIYPNFVVRKSKDLLIRANDFYAVWVEERGLWSTDEDDVIQLVDRELDRYKEENKDRFDAHVKVLYMWDSKSGMIDAWHRYCQKQMRDSFVMLDSKLLFANSGVNKKDYASKRLDYPLEEGEHPAWDKLVGTLYSEEERHKIEWCIGAVVSGASRFIHKFIVLYGEGGTGKSTILNVVQKLFKGYDVVFDAKALGSASAQFALEPFKKNPIVAIQHDGDLSRIEDNTRLNSLISHEEMLVNEKHKGQYGAAFGCFLFLGTNSPVKITNAKSGIIRRLIDASPSGHKLGPKEYQATVKQIDFELGAIAYHCQEVFLADPHYYDNYIPMAMMGASNDFYNFIIDSYHVFKKEDGTTLKAAWEMYKTYCDDAKVPYPMSRRSFQEELKNYFREYNDRFSFDDGSRVRSYYSGFRTERFEQNSGNKKEKPKPKKSWLQFEEIESVFDKECANCPAQYATSKETPSKAWDSVKTKLSSLDTTRLHYVKVEENHVVIDFDIPDENGNKCLERNIAEASKWPPTYAELSKSGQGVHLHYIYSGDPNKLSRVYDDHIEVKVFSGKSSLRRKLTKCNDIPTATISSGLPLKGEDKLVNFEAVKSEKGLRTLIKRNLNKEIHPGTKPSIDFIFKILEDAYNSELSYDVSDMQNAVYAFAANSTNQADYCIKLVNKMKFKSEEPSAFVNNDESSIVFYDVEVFPNLFLVNWKYAGEGKPVVRMINPSPTDITELIRFRLVGFNCRRYDNHILYARMMGYDNEQLYKLSQRIINSPKGQSNKNMFGEAYNLSYTDVYDFAATKQSLKKWEIELGIHHQELGLPWDQPVPEEMWTKVAEYCDNDVLATEAVFNHLKGDWTARQILADLAGMSVNDTTNTLTGRIIFGSERKPQGQFHYRNLAEPVYELDGESMEFLTEVAPEMMAKPHGEAKSLLPYFPGYKYEFDQSSKSMISTYKGVVVGEGGRVFAQPGMYFNVALLDVASMHPHSAIMEILFGVKFTRRFREIVYGRVHIKHEAWEEVNQMLDGKLTPYIQKVINGEMSSDDLATALKIAINSVYGLTAASFDTLFRDKRNKDNIVAKRGALFMVDLQEAVEKLGFTVVHIKTDSIKIANATQDIIDYVMEFGLRYGYTFEHEATYEKMCLVNDAVYIAKYATIEHCYTLYRHEHVDQNKDTLKKNKKKGGTWTATGKQFQVPYVFKKLFSKESIEFADICETKEVKTAIYLDMNEGLPDMSEYETILAIRRSGKADDKLSKKEKSLLSVFNDISDEELIKQIDEGHSYRFVGKVGNFCPIKPKHGGGELLRESKDKDGNVKYDSVTGAKGYRWLESEVVKELGLEKDIDLSYYNKLVDDAVTTISLYGDFEHFVSDDAPTTPVDFPLDDDDLPFYLGKELEEHINKIKGVH